MTSPTVYIGPFWFDLASTVPPMIWKEKSLKINALKFLRLYHLPDMFFPAEILVNYLMANVKKYIVELV